VSSDGPPEATVLTVCTGNAARSVMAGYMLEALAAARGRDWRVLTAGTHALDGQPMSMRTRAAIASIPELAAAPLARHRSRQLHDPDLEVADLVVAMEADHVRYVRRRHPAAAGRTGTLRFLSRALDASPPSLPERVARLRLAQRPLGEDEDVADPAGHEEEVYLACAHELWRLCRALADRL
jgi:protein-tyrosine-phosphatase